MAGLRKVIIRALLITALVCVYIIPSRTSDQVQVGEGYRSEAEIGPVVSAENVHIFNGTEAIKIGLFSLHVDDILLRYDMPDCGACLTVRADNGQTPTGVVGELGHISERKTGHYHNCIRHEHLQCGGMARIVEASNNGCRSSFGEGCIEGDPLNNYPGTFSSSLIVAHDLPLENGGHRKNQRENSNTATKNVFGIFMPSLPAWLIGRLVILIGCSVVIIGLIYFISSRFTVTIGLFMIAMIVDHFELKLLIFKVTANCILVFAPC